MPASRARDSPRDLIAPTGGVTGFRDAPDSPFLTCPAVKASAEAGAQPSGDTGSRRGLLTFLRRVGFRRTLS